MLMFNRILVFLLFFHIILGFRVLFNRIDKKTLRLYTENEKKAESTTNPSIRTVEWARARGMEPGFGGIWPGDPNAETYKVTVRSKVSNQEYVTQVPKDRYIYFVYEEKGVELPIINQPRMCRQGCCTICTAKLIEGKVKMDTPLGLLKEMRKEGYFLTCCAYPQSDIICELQNEDEMFIKQWSEGFEGGGVEWGGFLPEDD